MVGYQHLFASNYTVLKNLIDFSSHQLEVYSEGLSNGPFRNNVSVFRDWGSHEFSMAIDLFDEIPSSYTVRQIGVNKEGDNKGVYHAAAYKHVPLVETNVSAGIENNVFGTWACARAAIQFGVRHFVLVSTDKAVRPTNVMGATKRLAEMTLQALADDPANASTCFAMVRFGNVLGSSGSVIPLFNQQIEAGGPVTLTHEAMTRYFMTIPEAAQLVIQSGAMAKGGEVFVLDMGQPVRIADLARSMIQAKGMVVRDAVTPWGDIEIKVTGMRPGEKLYEELLIGDGAQPTEHPRVMRANEPHIGLSEMEALLANLAELIQRDDRAAIKAVLRQFVTGYQPDASAPVSALHGVEA